MVYGVMVHGLLCMVYGVMVYCVWCMVPGVWCNGVMVHGVWCMSSKPAHDEVYSIQHYLNIFARDLPSR